MNPPTLQQLIAEAKALAKACEMAHSRDMPVLAQLLDDDHQGVLLRMLRCHPEDVSVSNGMVSVKNEGTIGLMRNNQMPNPHGMGG